MTDATTLPPAPSRRFVTGLDAQGRSTVLFSGQAPSTVWMSDAAPARQDGAEDRGDPNFLINTPPGGTRCITFVYQPSDGLIGMGMHATDTLDYVIIISGSITLVTETEEVVLRQGDVVVQQGILQGWRNDSGAPCHAVCIMVDAQPVGEGKTIDEYGAPLNADAS